MHFFHLNFQNVWGISTQKIYNQHAIFLQFPDIKNEEWSQQPSVLGQLASSEPQHRPKES